MQLRSRQKFTPGGFKFYIPQTKWTAPQGSFSAIVDAIIAHRKVNPWLRQSTDRTTVENELDQFNAAICQQLGYTDYIIGGDPPNPPQPALPNLASRLVNVAGGLEPHVEWIASGAEAVPTELANSRAKTCTNINGDGKLCPMNEAGDLLRFFTLPAVTAIRKALNFRREIKLETPYDADLNICSACDCPMKLKVHMPLDRIKSKLKQEQLDRLHPKCWIKNE